MFLKIDIVKAVTGKQWSNAAIITSQFMTLIERRNYNNAKIYPVMNMTQPPPPSPKKQMRACEKKIQTIKKLKLIFYYSKIEKYFEKKIYNLKLNDFIL
jgi:hypothetical protein